MADDASLEGQLRTHAVADSPIADMIEPIVKRADAHGIATDAVDPRDGSGMLAAAVRIADGGWTLICMKSEEVVLAPAAQIEKDLEEALARIEKEKKRAAKKDREEKKKHDLR